MYRLFTLPEATNLLPVVDEHVSALQEAAADVSKLQQDTATLAANSVALQNHVREIAFLIDSMNTSKAELDRLGVMIRDVESGQIDFPSRLAGEVICLTWAKGQDAITHYHPLSGDALKRPLPLTGAKAASVA